MVSIELVSARKSMIIMLAILFSTSIFATSSSIIYSINTFNEYIYGNEADVLVIYDKSAQTPFTSRIPASYDLILNQIEGVTHTSPELIIPGIIDDNAVIMRGVNISSFLDITPIKLIDGDPIETVDRANIWIGKSVADRLGFQVGQLINFGGSLLNNQALLMVSGIVEGTPQIEDEIIAPLGVAEKLSRRGGEYNHIKVKFDDEIISKDQILDQLSGSYQTRVSLYHNNNTELYENIDLQIFDFSGDQVVYVKNQTVFELELPFGQYEFIFSSNETILHQETRTISNATSLEFVLPDFRYGVSIQTISSNLSGDMLYQVENLDSQIIEHGVFTPSDVIDLIVEQGQYQINILSPTGTESEIIEVDETTSIEIDVSSISYIPQISNLENQSSIPQNGLLSLETAITGVPYYFSINGSNPISVDTFYNYSLPSGNYNLSIQNLNQEILRIYDFQVNSSTGQSLSDFNNISMQKYHPNFDTTSPIMEIGSLNTTDDLINPLLVYNSIKVPENSNFSIEILSKLFDLNGTSIEIQKNIKLSSLNLVIFNDIGINPEDILVTHAILGNQTNPQKSGNDWFISNFPIGSLTVAISTLRQGTLKFQFELNSNEDIQIILEPIEEVSLNKFLALRAEIDGDIATEFFNQELTGPFAFFRIALLAESIVIIILLLVNVSAVYAGVSSEYRHELKTMKSIGFTNKELVLSIIRGSLKYSIPVILLGTLMGLGLSNLLLITNNTILFGHQFIPIFPLYYWIINIIVGHLLMVVGSWIGLKLENQTIIDAD